MVAGPEARREGTPQRLFRTGKTSAPRATSARQSVPFCSRSDLVTELSLGCVSKRRPQRFLPSQRAGAEPVVLEPPLDTADTIDRSPRNRQVGGFCPLCPLCQPGGNVHASAYIPCRNGVVPGSCFETPRSTSAPTSCCQPMPSSRPCPPTTRGSSALPRSTRSPSPCPSRSSMTAAGASPHAGDMTARITARYLIEHLEGSGFVLMKRLPARGRSVPGASLWKEPQSR